MYCFFASGLGMASVAPDYVAQAGEVLLDHFPPVVGEMPAWDTAHDPALQVQAQYTAAAQALLDSTAKSKGYDSMLSLASYATSSNATFKAEAEAGMAWRDAVWTEGYSLLAQVQAGTLALPTIDAFLAELPAMVWPA